MTARADVRRLVVPEPRSHSGVLTVAFSQSRDAVTAVSPPPAVTCPAEHVHRRASH